VLGELQRAAGAAERTVELLSTPNQIISPVYPKSLPVIAGGHIEIERLCFAYPSRPDVLAIFRLYQVEVSSYWAFRQFLANL
jgi:ATP-binding cassette subfamily B protein